MTKETKTQGRRNVGEIILRGRIYYIRYCRGRRRLETTKSTNRDEAEKQLRKRLTAKDAGVSPDAAVGKLTIKEATDDVITDYKTNGRKSLRDVTAKTALHLLPFFGERRRMTSITTADLRLFIAERQEAGAKAAEINRELAILRRAFNLAVQAGRLLAKPHFPMLKERNTRTGFLERDQIHRICSALETTETADDGRKKAGELANVVRFAFATGWRTASEVLPLQWRHVDWNVRTVRLDPGTTKNGEGRSFPFTAEIEKVLKEQLAIHENLKNAGTICPLCSIATASASPTSAPPGRTPAKPPAVRERWCMTCGDRRSERSSAPVCRGRWPCRSWGTRPNRSIADTRSWTKRCSERRRHALMPGWLPLR